MADSASSMTEPTIVEETDDLFRPTGVEAEEEQEAVPFKPYNPELIRVDPKTFSLRQILDMIDDGDLELAPDFQRLKVWTSGQKSRLIESILLRIPRQPFTSLLMNRVDAKLWTVFNGYRQFTILCEAAKTRILSFP
jgi:hypothetical protein